VNINIVEKFEVKEFTEVSH